MFVCIRIKSTVSMNEVMVEDEMLSFGWLGMFLQTCLGIGGKSTRGLILKFGDWFGILGIWDCTVKD